MSRLRAFCASHPYLAMWIMLSLGMIIVLLWAAAGSPTTAGQRAGLCAACIILAGACVRIITWES